MVDLFDNPVKVKKVRNTIFAYQYRNGNINIDGQTYVYYSMTDAIKRYRQKFPCYKRSSK